MLTLTGWEARTCYWSCGWTMCWSGYYSYHCKKTHIHTYAHTHKQRQSVMSHKKIGHLKPTFTVHTNNKMLHTALKRKRFFIFKMSCFYTALQSLHQSQTGQRWMQFYYNQGWNIFAFTAMQGWNIKKLTQTARNYIFHFTLHS